MNRILLPLAAVLSALAPLMLDSALKGAALLTLASLCALLLFKASAAARHLVWLVAVVALLVVPLLSLALPEWRVLPARKSASVDVIPVRVPIGSHGFAGSNPQTQPAVPQRTVVPSSQPSTPPLPPAPSPAAVSTPLPEARRASLPWIPTVWTAGFLLLAFRLLASHLLLRVTTRRATVPPVDSSLTATFKSCHATIGVRQRVTLLLDGTRTIPVVWGVFRPRLLLPAEALDWSDSQLRSVLLHELAHVKRRDTLVQWLAQIACALHWWNPLVWLAAWRLHVERERACDDSVLASGVRPSAYAEHLLEVATKLSPARWTHGCGLAMARKSSLEGRLLAVLSEKLNRRGVPRALGVAVLLLGAAIAIPLSMLRAEDEKPAGAAKPKEAVAKVPLKPWSYQRMDASLLRRWQKLEGKESPIPESRLAGLRSAIGRFVEGIDASPFSVTPAQITELKALQTQGAGKEQHTAAETEKLLQAVFAIHGEPIQMAFNEAPRPGAVWTLADLQALPFGPPAPNGLRVALNPRRREFIFGDAGRLDLQFWNSGKEILVVGNGSDAPGLYPKLELRAVGQDGRKIATITGPEGKMLADIKFTKTWQLRPGETVDVFGYLLRVGPGKPREQEGWPAWYSFLELADVRSGEEITLTGHIPYPSAPGAQVPPATLQTGSITIRATAPSDVAIWSAPGVGKWSMPGGVTLQLKRESFHATDVATRVVLTWPKDAAKITHAHTTSVASDAFANRVPWHVAWEKNTSVFWAMTGRLGEPRRNAPGLPTPSEVRRIAFADKNKITTTTWHHQPMAMPDEIHAEFLKVFKPLPAEPRWPGEANGRVSSSRAHDVNPIGKLLNGVWKNKGGHIEVRLTFPDHQAGKVQWTIGFKRQTGVSVVTASLSRIRKPAENAIGLYVDTGKFESENILGSLRRGPGNTLLLDIRQSPNFPDYDAVNGIVLVRDDQRSSDAPKRR